ncbi:MAG: SPOR domain-containing protein [Gemmatimonadaceae bacterium]|nr:SPOR domain-containing protein [Gemmatimonadaceae bacterium]
MIRRALRPSLVCLVWLLVSAGVVRAQTSAGVTSAVGRARGLMDAGDGAKARTLLDSLVAHTDPSSDDMAEALYWRAVLSERVADGERDWKRLVVDAPLSPRVPEALLRLGELEILRGRPAVARAHYERILRDFSESPQRPKAMIQVVRSYFEERDILHACESVTALRGVTIPEGELRLQANDLQLRCAAAAATAAGGTANGVAVPTPAVTTPAPAAAVSAATVFSVQLAAYDTRAQATALVKRLATRGVKARVDGERKPFRVRVGRYETRAEAAAMLTRLKKQGQRGFVAELGR